MTPMEIESLIRKFYEDSRKSLDESAPNVEDTLKVMTYLGSIIEVTLNTRVSQRPSMSDYYMKALRQAATALSHMCMRRGLQWHEIELDNTVLMHIPTNLFELHPEYIQKYLGRVITRVAHLEYDVFGMANNSYTPELTEIYQYFWCVVIKFGFPPVTLFPEYLKDETLS